MATYFTYSKCRIFEYLKIPIFVDLWRIKGVTALTVCVSTSDEILGLSAQIDLFTGKDKLRLWNLVVYFHLYPKVSWRIPCSYLLLRLNMTDEVQWFSPLLHGSILSRLPKEAGRHIVCWKQVTGCVVCQTFWILLTVLLIMSQIRNFVQTSKSVASVPFWVILWIHLKCSRDRRSTNNSGVFFSLFKSTLFWNQLSYLHLEEDEFKKQGFDWYREMDSCV